MISDSRTTDSPEVRDEFDDSDSLPPFVLPTVASECANSAAETVVPGIAEPSAEPQHIGDYELLRELGRGGMGVVYEARDRRLNRRVALKVLPPSAVLDPRRISRFQLEAQAVARLSHPHIVQVFDVGASHGTHYLAMQLIDGQSLSALLPTDAGSKSHSPIEPELASVRLEQEDCDKPDASAFRLSNTQANRTAGGLPSNGTHFASGSALAADVSSGNVDPELPVASAIPLKVSAIGLTLHRSPIRFGSLIGDVVRWGRQAAEALDHAHKMGVVHRDVKPSNMIVDAHGDVWLTDFGLAQVADAPSVTLSGDLMGTLRYLSPEQAMARRIPIDHRTDIYSLGVTLYELLAGKPAFPETDRAELLRRIIFESPRPLRRVQPDLPKPLQTIVHKAIEKNPNDRYATAQELADDLRRFHDDEPIHAKPPSWFEQAARWSRHNRRLVASGVLLLLISAVVGWLMAGRLKVERDEVAKAKDEATLSEQKARRNEWRSLVAQIGLSRRADRANRRDECLKLIDRAVELGRDLAIDDADQRSLRNELIACLALQDDLSLERTMTHESGRYHLEFSPLGNSYARTAGEAGIEIHNPVGSLRSNLPAPFEGSGSSVFSQFSPNGRWLIVRNVAAGRDQAVVWDLELREIAYVVPMEPGFQFSDFSHNGEQFVTFVDVAHFAAGAAVAAGQAGEVRVINLASRESVRAFALNFVPVNTIAGPLPNQVTFFRAVAGTSNPPTSLTEFSIWDIATGAFVSSLTLPDEWRSGVWSRGGRWLAIGNHEARIAVWDQLQQRFAPIQRDSVLNLGFSPDDRLLAVESSHEETELWDLAKGRLVSTSPGRFSRFVQAAPHEPLRIALHDSRSVTLFQVHRGAEFQRIDLPLSRSDAAAQAEFSLEGRSLAIATSSGVFVIDFASNQVRQHHAAECYSAVFGTLNGTPALLCGTRSGIESLPFAMDSQTLGNVSMLHTGVYGAAQRHLAATPDGRTVAAITDAAKGLVWHADAPMTPALLDGHALASFIAVSPDGRRAVTTAWHGSGVRVWNARTGQLEKDVWPEAFSAQGAFTPNGRELLVSESRRYRLIELDSGRSRWELDRTDASDANAPFAISPDGRLIAITPSRREVHLIDATTLADVATLDPSNRDATGALRFSPDGQLLTRCSGSSLEIWNLERILAELQRRKLSWPVHD